MHEMSIAMKMLREAKKQRARGSITILLGDLSGLTEDELREALRSISEVKVFVERVKGKISCLSCGFSGEPKIVHREHGYVLACCPKCNGRRLKVLAGNEIGLKPPA